MLVEKYIPILNTQELQGNWNKNPLYDNQTDDCHRCKVDKRNSLTGWHCLPQHKL